MVAISDKSEEIVETGIASNNDASVKVKKKKYSLKAQAGYLFAGKMIAFFVQFLIPVIFVRFFSKEGYGLYRKVMLMNMFLLPILEFGFVNSLYYFYPNAKEKAKQLLSQTFFLCLATGIVFLCVFFTFKAQMLPLVEGKGMIKYIYPAGLLVFFMLVSTMLDDIFVLERRSKLVLMSLVINDVSRALVIVISVILSHKISAVIWSLVGFSAARSVFLFTYLKLKYGINLNFKTWDKKYFFSHLNYAIPLGMSRAVAEVGRRMDQFIVSVFCSAADFAVYSIAKFNIPIVNMIYYAVGNVVLQQLSRYNYDDNQEEVRKLWHKMIENFAIITVPMVTYFIVMANPIVTFLYTDEYAESANIYRISLLILFTQMLGRGTIMRASEETKTMFKINLFTMIVGIVLGYLGVKTFGLMGAATASVFTFYVNAFLQVLQSKRILGLKFSNVMPWKNLGRIVLASVIPAIMIYPLLFVKWPKIVVLALSCVIYAVVLAFLYEKWEITQVLPKIKEFAVKKGLMRAGAA